MHGWDKSEKTLSGVARKYPQSAYKGLQKSLQQDCEFVQRFTPNMGDDFGPVGKALEEAFIPALFHGLREGTPGREFTRLPMK